MGIDNFYIDLYIPFIEIWSQFILKALESMPYEICEETEKRNLRGACKYTNLKEKLCMVLRFSQTGSTPLSCVTVQPFSHP